ncbi:MAG: FtsX-like permease family protein [Lachnospiraceae bacterium]|jgi:putative ABC transport system permease protein|nr:FtsX-like permease family protein [Lachnospiraceae bacterium]
MAQIFEYIKMALMNIKSNKGRSVLTMLGIIIGISSVIMIVSIGNGVSAEINSELENLAGGQIAIYSNSGEGKERVTFNQEDFDAVKKQISHVKGVTPQESGYATARSPKGEFTAYIYGGTEDFKYTQNDPIVKGSFYTKTDYESANKVCVIRESSAIALFGTTDVIGKTFEVEMWGSSVEVRIIGIRKDNSSSLLGGMMDYDEVEMEMPLTSFGDSFGYWIEDYSMFYIVADSPATATEVAGKALSLIKARHPEAGKDDIQLQDFNDSLSQINSIVGYITVFVVLVAAISLLVGGIGVMNIMLVSVTERTREIGIRKALGAKTKSIMTQFLAESAIITLLGGLIGILLGSAGAVLVCTVLKFKAVVDPGTVLIATLFSSAVGIFFGLYPAKRAAKLSPIDALRHE